VGRKLSGGVPLNQAVNGFLPEATAANIQQRRPLQAYALIEGLGSMATSSYNGLQFSARRRFAHGYTFQAAYTFSKAIDNRSGTTRDDEGLAQDPNNFHSGERGLSGFHQKHILALNGVWDLPLLEGHGILTTLFGAWQFSGQLRLASGLPFSVVSGRDVALTGGPNNQRPNVVGSAVLGDRSTAEEVARYFNTSAFAFPAKGRFGDSGRNNLVGPGFVQPDLAVNKRFPLSETLGALEFRAEFFSLLNQSRFLNPVNNLGSPAFGQIVGAREARQIQFALRYDF
jgi:hypothetical protein